MRSFLNYFGQIRIYSLLDVIVFGLAVASDIKTVVGIAILWISFILLLEAFHKDELRLRVNHIFWLIPFIISFFLLPYYLPILFIILSIAYAQKKKGYWGLFSPVFRGLQNTIIANAFNPALVIPAFVLNCIRNLIGDFRDGSDDYRRNIKTIPVVAGLRKNYLWAFWGHLLFVVGTTIFWSSFTNISLKVVGIISVIQILSYPLTPRLSNPAWTTKLQTK